MNLARSIVIAIFFLVPPASAEEGPLTREVDLSWAPVDNARLYQLEVTPIASAASDQKVQTFETTDPTFKRQMAVGRYEIRIRTVDQRGVPGAFSAPMQVDLPYPEVEAVAPLEGATLSSSDATNGVVRFTWKTLGRGALYKIFVRNERGKVVARTETSDLAYECQLAVARKYTWQALAFVKGGPSGPEWPQGKGFLLEGAPLSTPEIDPDIDLERPILRWSKVAKAASYAVELKHRKGPKGTWNVVFSDQKYKKKTLSVRSNWPKGEYQISVIAQGTARPSSAAATLGFDTGMAARLAAKKRRAQHLVFAYAYMPAMRTVSLSTPSANTSLRVWVLNGHGVSGTYQFLRLPVLAEFATELTYSRAVLFDQARVGQKTATPQAPLILTTLDPSAKLRLGLAWWRLRGLFEVGAGRRRIYKFYSDLDSTFAIAGENLPQRLWGGSLALLVGESTTLSAAVVNKGSGAGEGGPVTAYRDSEVTVRVSRPLQSESFEIGAGATRGVMTFQYPSPVTVEPYTTVWTEYRLGLSLTYTF